jgi:hypothetical protein
VFQSNIVSIGVCSSVLAKEGVVKVNCFQYNQASIVNHQECTSSASAIDELNLLRHDECFVQVVARLIVGRLPRSLGMTILVNILKYFAWVHIVKVDSSFSA